MRNLIKLPEHPNIVKLIAHGENGIYKKFNKKEKTVCFLVFELQTGGELFDFITDQESPFTEK